MPNLGDIDRQSIAGAIATATHGTGLGLGNLATTVVEMELVTGSGDVVRLDAAADAELLRVARVGVGALGIVTEVTLQCVPAFVLHARETIEPLDDILDGLLDQAAAVDHFELYWMPGGGKRCQVKRNVRTDEPARPQSRLGYAARQVARREPRVGPDLSCRPPLPTRHPDRGQADDRRGGRARRDRSQRQGVLHPAEGALRRDGVRPARRAPRRRSARAARGDEAPADADPVPGRGPRLGRRRHPAVDRLRPDVGLDRRAPVPRRAVRGVLRARRADHGRSRRAAALGQAARPAGRDLGAPLPAVGRLPGCAATSSTPTARSPTRTSSVCSAEWAPTR